MDVLVPLLAITALFLIPIGGATLILTTRFAFKPLVESLSKALRESGHTSHHPQTGQIQELTEQVEALAAEVRQLKEGQEFDRRLLASASETVDGTR